MAILARTRGFTVIELLVAIGIIGALVALIIPAVHAAREAARRSECRNHLKQMGLAANSHLVNYKFYPAGGWGYRWVGDPNYGFDTLQPGGWMYNLLPYLEEQALHDFGKGLSGNQRQTALKQAAAVVVPIYYCPSRREAQAIPYIFNPPGTPTYFNAPVARGEPVARNDYAACSGSEAVLTLCPGPSTYDDHPAYACWNGVNATMNGLTVLPRSGLISLAKVQDGVSKTILYGEKLLRPLSYDTNDADNDQSWNMGHDHDINRWCNNEPLQDFNGYPTERTGRFGSVHPGGMHCTMADGSVHTIAYSIDRKVFRRLGVRNDGLPVAMP